jgi:hypothetical protein
LRDRAETIALILLISYALIIGLHLLAPERFGGVIFGITLTVPVWAVVLAVMTDPSASAWAQGGEAEDWTTIELRRALGNSAVVIDDVQFDHSNADHVIVGAFGVVIAEVKWSSAEWATSNGYKNIERAAKQAAEGARRISRLLRDHGIDMMPTTLVVVWGGRAGYWTEGSRVRIVAKTTVVPGQFISEWVRTLNGSVLSKQRVIDIANVIRAIE